MSSRKLKEKRRVSCWYCERGGHPLVKGAAQKKSKMVRPRDSPCLSGSGFGEARAAARFGGRSPKRFQQRIKRVLPVGIMVAVLDAVVVHVVVAVGEMGGRDG